MLKIWHVENIQCAITTTLLYQSWMSNVFAIPWNFPSKKLFTCPMDTVLCKSNANDYRRLLRFVLPIYRRISVIYRSFSWHLKNDKSTRYGSSPAIYRSRDILLKRYIVERAEHNHGISLQWNIVPAIYRWIRSDSLRYIVLAIYRLSEFSYGEKCLSILSLSSEIIISYLRFLPHYVLVYVSCWCYFSASAKLTFNDSVVNRYIAIELCKLISFNAFHACLWSNSISSIVKFAYNEALLRGSKFPPSEFQTFLRCNFGRFPCRCRNFVQS